MYQEFPNPVVKTRTEIMSEYAGLAYLIIDTEHPYKDGIWEETRGKLVAIADISGVPQLRRLRDFYGAHGHKTSLVDSLLYSNVEC